jgi:hypothetical protein
LAGGGVECRNTLKAQGALKPLVDLLQSPVSTVVQSSAFALSNFSRDKTTQCELVACGVFARLAPHLVHTSPSQLPLIAEVTWVLTYLAASGEHTDAILTAGLFDRLTMLVVSIADVGIDNFQVLTPVLRSLGNLACRINTDLVTQLCNNERLVSTLGRLLQSEHLHLRKETLWIISNITVFPLACRKVSKEEMLPSIIHLLSSTIEIRKEAAYCLCNIAAQGGDGCAALLQHGALTAIVPLLKVTEPDCAHMGLSLVEMLLCSQPEATEQFESSGGLDRLEALEYCNNVELCSQTNHILECFFYKDDS